MTDVSRARPATVRAAERDAAAGVVARPAPARMGRRLEVRAEVLAYAALAATALLLRAARLDWMPLDPREAAMALPAWRSATGAGGGLLPSGAIDGPLAFQLQRLAFWLAGGGGEVVARFGSVLAGTAAVVLAYRLRPMLGRAGALAAALILALDPAWVFVGRHASADALGTAAIVALLGALVGRFSRDMWIAPIAAGLALAAGGPAWPALAVLLVYGVARYARRGSSLADDVAQLWPTPEARRGAAIALVVTVLLAATGLASRPDGLAGIASAPAAWLSALLRGSAAGRLEFVLALLVYSPAVLVAGVAGSSMLSGLESPIARYVAWWTAISLLVGLLLGPAGVAGALLPLTLAAGYAVGRLADTTVAGWRWLEDGVMIGILLVVLGHAVVQLWSAARFGDASPGPEGWSLGMGSLALAALLTAAYAVLWRPPTATRTAGWALLAVLALVGWANGSSLSYRPADVLREPLRPEYTAPGAAAMARAAATASWARTRDPLIWSMAAPPQLEPALGWALRERRVRWGPVEAPVAEELVAVPSDADARIGPRSYLGQTYVVGGRWTPAFAGRQDLLRWLLHRRSSATTDVALERADLYVVVDEGGSDG